MDWSKSKTILIVALIFTNVILLALLIEKNHSFIKDDEDVKTAILKENNVFIECTLPKITSSLANSLKIISVTPKYMEDHILFEQLNRQKSFKIEKKTDEEILEYSDAFLIKCGVKKEYIEGEKVVEKTLDKLRVRYSNSYDGIPIEQSYIKCTFGEDSIEDVEMRWYQPIDAHEGNKNIISATDALIEILPTLYEKEETHINKVELVYWIDSEYYSQDVLIEDTALPTWKITYNENMVEYISAYQ